MNKEQLETFIRSIKEGSDHPRIIHLCEAYEAFMVLYIARNQEQNNPEAFEKKLNSSYRTMWDSFYAAAETFGLEGEQLLKPFVTTEQMQSEGMRGLDYLRQSFEALEGPAPELKNNKKSKNKNVRI
jgi:hypothetical protein